MSILLQKITPISTSPFQYFKTKIINIIQIIPNSKHQRSQNQLPKNNRENFIQKSCHVSVMSKSCQKLYQRSNSMSPPLVVPFFFKVIAMIHQLSLIELKSLTCLILGELLGTWIFLPGYHPRVWDPLGLTFKFPWLKKNDHW